MSLVSRLAGDRQVETTHRGSGGTVEGLLALDGDVGAIGSLELDLKVGWVALLAGIFLRYLCGMQRASLCVVEVLVDELDACLSVYEALSSVDQWLNSRRWRPCSGHRRRGEAWQQLSGRRCDRRGAC